MKERNSKSVFLPVLVLVFSLSIIFILVFLLFSNNSSTIISDGGTSSKQKLLICSVSENLDGPLYYSEASDVSHSLKFLFNEKQISSVFYEYSASFSSPKIAEGIITNAHANYDTYFHDSGVSSKPESHFNYVGKKGNITLRAIPRQVNIYSGKYLFLDDVIANNFAVRNKEEIENYYRNKGFSCKSN